MEKTDGFGDKLIPDGHYYVQDSRGVVGNCALWWRKEGNGYSCNLDEAGIYPGTECARMRDTDIAWPEQYVLNNVIRHVRLEPLHAVKKAK